MVEALGISLNHAHKEGHLKGSKPIRMCTLITHHKFVDDIILKGQAQEKEARNLQKILKLYEKASHQKINLQKFEFFIPFSRIKKLKINCKNSWM